MQPEDLSFVAQKILSKFIRLGNLSYSAAQPDDVDNDLYKYHLNHLLEKAILEKTATGYVLTPSGQSLVHKLDVYGKPTSPIQISVLCFVTNSKNQVLLHQRKRQPYANDIELIAGKLLPGELPQTAASRKLLEESGLSAKFVFVGVYRAIRCLKSELFQDTIYHICRTTNPTGHLINTNDWGNNFWVDSTEVIKQIKSNQVYSPVLETMYTSLLASNPVNFYLTDKIFI